MVDKEHNIATYESLISISTEGYKFLGLINGGALIAMLTFVGNLMSKGVKLDSYHLPFYYFSFGLIACGFAMLFGYLTQFLVFNNKKEKVSFAISILFYILSLMLFFVGCFKSIDTFKSVDASKNCLKISNVIN